MNQSKLPIGVCAIIRRDDKFLAVSRKDNRGMWGLPGGKVDMDETIEQALLREVLEETNLQVSIDKILHTEICKGETDYLTIGFICHTLSDFEYDSYIQTEPGCYYEWLTEEELCSPYMSPFWKYNINLFKALQSC